MSKEWIGQAVVKNMVVLLSLNLSYSPTGKQIAIAHKAWIGAFIDTLGNAIKEIDEPRIDEAFRAAIRELKQWPSPYEVIRHMPPRPSREKVEYSPELSPEKGRLAFQLCGDVIDGVLSAEEAVKIFNES